VRDEVGADLAAGAAAIFDDEWLPSIVAIFAVMILTTVSLAPPTGFGDTSLIG
jgi:hypothetical protein